MCRDEGYLLTYLDGQLSPREGQMLEAHLKACSRCSRLLERLSREREEVTRILRPYHGACLNMPVGKPPARHAPSVTDLPKKGVLASVRRYYKWIAAAAVLGLLLGYAPARSLATQFLRVFRVERVAVLHFDPADMTRLREALESYGPVNVENFGRVETEPLPAPDRVVKLPAAVGGYTLQSTHDRSGAVVKVTPDADGINEFLARLGSGTLLPREIDGRTFTITIPGGSVGRYVDRVTDRTLVAFVGAAPTLQVPEGVDMLAVRDALLRLPVLPGNWKKALEGIDDWTRTLPVPDPTGRAEEITLDGAPGFFLPGEKVPRAAQPSGETHSRPAYLAWCRDGTWTVFEAASETTRDEALTLARQWEASYGR